MIFVKMQLIAIITYLKAHFHKITFNRLKKKYHLKNTVKQFKRNIESYFSMQLKCFYSKLNGHVNLCDKKQSLVLIFYLTNIMIKTKQNCILVYNLRKWGT